MSNAILAYVPDIPRLHPDAFLRNLNSYKTESEVILYSCSKRDGCELIPDPTPIKSSKNRVAIHNLVFLAGLKIAEQRGVKRFIYLELDCRVGYDYWDKAMFDEVKDCRDMFMAGTPARYNRDAMPGKQKFHTDQYCALYEEATGFKVPVFPSKVKRPLGCVFLMGAGSIMNTAVASDLFLGFEKDSISKASKTPAFDLFIGMRCVQLFGVNATMKLPFLMKSFSTYGNKVNTEKDRIEMVKSGKWALVHQIKSNNDCL